MKSEKIPREAGRGFAQDYKLAVTLPVLPVTRNTQPQEQTDEIHFVLFTLEDQICLVFSNSSTDYYSNCHAI